LKIQFWLLDINHETVNAVPEIRLWGLDETGNSILVIDRSFHPYFYVVPKSIEDIDDLVNFIQNNKEIFNVTSVAIEEKKYFGIPKKAIKIICNDSNDIISFSKILMKNPKVEATFADDIRYSSLYLIDREVTPCSWHEIEVDEAKITNNIHVDKVYVAKSSPRVIEKWGNPPLNILAFYAVFHAKMGTPKPDRDPILAISILTNKGEIRTFVTENHDDKKILCSFVDYIHSFNPDVIIGYGTNRRDFHYLLERAHKIGLKLAIGRTEEEPHTSVYGHISVIGRANVDLLDYAEDLTEVKVKTLENVAEFLIGTDKKNLIRIEETEICDFWEIRKSDLIKFCEQNAILVMRLSNVLLDYALQLSNLIGIPLDYVGAAATGFKVDWYLIRESKRFNELIPKKADQPYYPYKGAMVLKPKPGVHENVAVMDFTAMYPNLMINYNLSPDTLVRLGEKESELDVYVAPEVGHKFRKEPPGFYKQVLTDLIRARKTLQEQMEKFSSNSSEYRLLDARQRGIKVLTNAVYGYCGWTGARWYVREVAEATTAWGRKTIMTTIELAKKSGLEVVYSDTDSVFVKYDEVKIKNFLATVEKEIGLKIKPDVIYNRILFTEAKKRYAGIMADEKLDIVGLEVSRGDWADVARFVQEKVLEIILKDNNLDKAVNFVKDYLIEVDEARIPFKEFIIWKTLTKPVEEYEVRAPHVEAAKRLMKEGWQLTLGDKIGYIIIKGSGKLFERAIPFVMAKPEEVDTEYYKTNQIIPSALRILTLFNITEKDLTGVRSKPSKQPKPSEKQRKTAIKKLAGTSILDFVEGEKV
jgi:DNA polymerase I